MAPAPRPKPALTVLAGLLLLLVLVFLASVRWGAVPLGAGEIASSLGKAVTAPEALTLNERIFIHIRLPRALLCLLVGASLAVGGALMQGLFRNPIVEPGLVGTSSGAAFGAALYFVLGAVFKLRTGEWTLPLAACAGGLISTSMVFLLAQPGRTGRSSIVSLLLTGIAVNALFLSGVGFMAYIARDPQARSITFWNLGTLSGANWHSVAIVGVSAAACLAAALFLAKPLNALMIGEEEARHLGVDTRRLKLKVMAVNVAMVAVATAFTGVIAFVGLIVPHLVRMLMGSDNRRLIPCSALLGAMVLSCADLLARLLLRPAELPIGIVTSAVGAPIFIVLLRRKEYLF
jgi:iron complex transport system permease protein